MLKVTELTLAGVKLIEPPVYEDARGFFMESYNQRSFEEAGITMNFVQDNHSLSVEAGTLRGLHYQSSPRAQSKLVRVASGAIFDVAVDLRQASPGYGHWLAVLLTEWNHRQLLIPQGFAHGFCTLVPNTQVIYKVDEAYSREHDRGIRWDDPDIAIDWPMTPAVLSDKDRALPLLKELTEDQL